MEFQTFVSKLRKRATRIISRRVSFNTKYKPTGVCDLLSMSSDLVEYRELNPSYTSVLALEPEFIEKCSPSLKPVVSVKFPADYFAVIRNGRVYSSNENNIAIISSNNQLIDQASFQWDGDKILPGKQNEVFNVKGFVPPRKYQGNVFSLLSTGAAKHFYYHWVFELLPKLFLLQRSGYMDKVDYFLIPYYEFRYQREYLDYFRIPKEKLINEEYHRHIQAENLMICSYIRNEMHHPKWACDFLYSSFRLPDRPRKRDNMIYIGRGDAARNRKVINEPELVAVLEGYGFQTCFLTQLSVSEQADLFNSARIVVGAHGAGLSNLVYCETGTKVLEIFPDNYVRHGFHDICNKRGLEYHYMLCKSDGEQQHHSTAQRLDLLVDIDEVKSKIEAFLATGPHRD